MPRMYMLLYSLSSATGAAGVAGAGACASAPASSPGPRVARTGRPAVPITYRTSENSGPGDGTSPSGSRHAWHADAYTMCVSGSYEAPGQFVPPLAVPSVSVARGPAATLITGGVKTGPSLYRDASFAPSARSSGVKSISSSADTPLREYAGGLVGIGCVGAYHSPGTAPFSTGRSSIGQTGWPLTRSKTYRIPCLVGCATALIARPFTVMSARIGAEEMSMSHRG